MKKKCTKCKKTKDVSDFHKDKNRKDGYNHYCKSCVKKKRLKSQTKKTCHVCKQEKPISQFHAQTSRCKVCDKKRTRTTIKSAQSTENIEKLIQALDATRTNILRTKQCEVCTKVKDIEEFPRNSKNIDGCDNTCHRCKNRSKAKNMTERELIFDSGVDKMEILYITILEELNNSNKEPS